MERSGLIVFNKPQGITSRQAVDVVKRLVRPAKTGHAGTLDPLATGVLVVCVGGATRLIEYVQRMPKQYRATFLLGQSSPTEDIEGEVAFHPEAALPSLAEIHRAASRLTGEIMQRPPAFSALKVQGRRAYDLARAGHEVDLQPRPVTIYRLEILRYDYPELSAEIECSSGTYVRSLGRDLAESLGSHAVMSSLLRTAIGGFRVEEACPPEQLTRENLAEWLLPPERAVEALPAIHFVASEAKRIAAGLSVARPVEAGSGSAAGVEHAAIGPDGRLLGIVAPLPDGAWRAVRNMPTTTEASA